MGGLQPTDVRASLASLMISWGLSLSICATLEVVDGVSSVGFISVAKNGVPSFSAWSVVRRAAGLAAGENADVVVSSVDMTTVDIFRIIFVYFNVV